MRKCTLKPILEKMAEGLDLFTEENLHNIWMYEGMGNRLSKQQGQDVDEIREELVTAKEALQNSSGRTLNGIGRSLDQLE